MLKELSIEEQFYCGYEVENNRDYNDFDLGREYVACPFYLDEGFSSTYLRWVDPEGTQWKKDIIIRLDKEKEELKDEVLNLRRQIDDMAVRKEEHHYPSDTLSLPNTQAPFFPFYFVIYHKVE